KKPGRIQSEIHSEDGYSPLRTCFTVMLWEHMLPTQKKPGRMQSQIQSEDGYSPLTTYFTVMLWEHILPTQMNAITDSE
ncbi:hypothetical protein J6590_107409, partial [Homalodisca vitripennis]